MLKKYKYLMLVLMPAVLLLGAVGVLSYQINHGKEVTVRIRGYDPISLLSGHYIRYEIDWENTDCAQFSKNICPKEDFMRALNNGYWGKSGRFYVSEESAEALDRAVRDSQNSAEIIYSYQEGRSPYALRLLINGEVFQADKR